jgi:hypothetical protein
MKGYQTRKRVAYAAGAKAHNDPHRPGRIGLRPRNARDGRQRGSTRGEMQKLPSVGKVHMI